MRDLTINHETASAYVDQAGRIALASAQCWFEEIMGLGLPTMQATELTFALVDADDCRAGQLMRLYLGPRIKGQAKDRAREELIEKYGKEVVA